MKTELKLLILKAKEHHFKPMQLKLMKKKVQNGMIKSKKIAIFIIILSTKVMINCMSLKFPQVKMLALSMSHPNNSKIKKLKLCVRRVFKLNMFLSSVNIIKKG